MSVYQGVARLVQYGIITGLIEEEDRIYVRNRILSELQITDYEEDMATISSETEKSKIEISETETQTNPDNLEEILKVLLDYACEQRLIEDSIVYRDLFDTKLMDCLTPYPREVIRKFYSLYKSDKIAATEYYYKLSQDSDYIRRYRIQKDVKWVTKTEYGDLDITINLSKPEKDPKAIAALIHAKNTAYPACQLCKENEGYAGRVNHPARNTLRTIPITMNQEPWFLQYSPYVYYNEHCIVFRGEHSPMKIDRTTFAKLFDFIQFLPHYFVGSNADLPIVGGSILTHEHYQGGNYTFAMAKAKVEEKFTFEEFKEVEVAIVKWPMSVLRLRGKETEAIVELAERIRNAWGAYSDESAMIYAKTEETLHNTITPIARKVSDYYELDLVLRNNITTKEHPDGLYHPHQEHHHIKKENIGLIEVMGFAILPSRLLLELEEVKACLLQNKNPLEKESTAKHAGWITTIRNKYSRLTDDRIDDIIKDEVGLAFCSILEQAGVFKRTKEGKQAFLRFMASLGAKEL
nr:UDP-glucose--hexose-1-phosphate uridylyltransferase [uncultured Lachnoclostridium sp.]